MAGLRRIFQVLRGKARWPSWLNRKVAIPSLIALVSATGVVSAWRASNFGGAASAKSRQLIGETIALQQIAGRVSTQLAADSRSFAQYRIEEMAARQLASDAVLLQNQGYTFQGTAAETEARTRHDLAERLLSLQGLTAYVSRNPQTSPSFDVASRQANLQREYQADRSRLDPDAARVTATRLEARSQRVVGWIVALAALGLVLTVAQVSRRHLLKISLAALGAIGYVLVTLLSVVTTRA